MTQKRPPSSDLFVLPSDRLYTLKGRNHIQRRRHIDPASTIMNLQRIDILPFAVRQVKPSDLHTRFHDRRNQIIRAKHVLCLNLPADLILWEIIKHRTHDWFASFVRTLHLCAHIRTKRFAPAGLRKE